MSWPEERETERVPLATVLPLSNARGEMVITVSKGQPWDGFLRGAFGGGAIVLVLDHEERPLYAFRRAGSGNKGGN